ncbi:MAG TPA: ABC transporter permease [candidate division Zixibacteria bacterium]|nr:ABC transporter permease [candidate division Zixibacteria bacterium]
MNARLKSNAASILVLLALWEICGRAADSVLIPPLSRVAAAWIRLAASGRLWDSLLISLATLAAGFCLAAAAGVVVGLLMGRFREVEHLLDLYINALMSAPATAFVPVLILWLGLGVASRIAVVFFFAFFVVVVNTLTGVKQVDRTFLEMARSFGARETEIFFKVMLPAAAPAIFAGIRLGMGRAVKGMVTGEMLLTLTGMGGMIMQYGSAFATDALFAVILTVLVVALITTKAVQLVDRRLTGWKAEIAVE